MLQIPKKTFKICKRSSSALPFILDTNFAMKRDHHHHCSTVFQNYYDFFGSPVIMQTKRLLSIWFLFDIVNIDFHSKLYCMYDISMPLYLLLHIVLS
jgi:hypothetical protein